MDLVSLVIKDLTKHINFQIVSGNRERVKNITSIGLKLYLRLKKTNNKKNS